MKSMKRFRIALAMVVGVLATTVVPTQAQAATCGVYRSGVYVYYNNCRNTKAYVHVNWIVWPDDYVCLTPGIHKLGNIGSIAGATYMYDCGGI